MIFLVDAQLPPFLAQAMNEAGHPAKHVEELGLRDARDQDIWQYAVQHDLAVMTKDFDFVERGFRMTHGPAVIWLRLGNCSRERLVAAVLSRISHIQNRLQAGDRLIEIG